MVSVLTVAAASATMLAGCNTSHPEAKITIEYGEGDSAQTYVLNYTLYRNMYPQTVQHFIELADNDFYDNTIIHNYQSSGYWYGGGYDYIETEELSYKSSREGTKEEWLTYMERASKEEAYANLADPAKGKITPSVYRNFVGGKYDQPLTTLIGEFSTNQHKIDNGALKGSFGALRMHYTDKDDCKQHVYLNKKGSDPGVMGEYRYNSATSLFSIQTSTSTSSDSYHAIFGTLKNPDALTDLSTAVKKNPGTDSITFYTDNYDAFLDQRVKESTYTMTTLPIIIRSVEIVKY